MDYTEMESDKKTVAKQRATRLKTTREMTGLTRKKFQDRYGIPKGTLQNWESARFNGLTVKGANVIINAFLAEGINCSAEWLLHGTNAPPSFPDNSEQARYNKLKNFNSTTAQSLESESKKITKEVLIFRQNNPNSIDMIIPDNTMQPRWSKGDYIAGHKYFKDDILATCKHCSIVQTKKYGTLFRYIDKGHSHDRYNLFVLDITTNTKMAALYDVELMSSSPVIWTRKVDS